MASVPLQSRSDEDSLSACDRLLWTQVKDQAIALMEREPLLVRRLLTLVCNAPNPEVLLANVIASRLSSRLVSEVEFVNLARSAYAEDGKLIAAAENDIRAVVSRDPATPNALAVVVSLKGFHALQTHRIAHHLWNNGRQELAYFLAQEVALVWGIDIHPAARIGQGVMLDHGTGLVIGETTVIENDVSILQGVTLGGTGKDQGDRHPKIGRGVLLGAGATVLGNIRVGEFSKVAAGSVVVAEVAPRTTVAGVPATVVRHHHVDSCPGRDMDQTI